MGRRTEYRLDRPLLDDFTAIHDGDIVRDTAGYPKVVSHDHQRDTKVPTESLQQFKNADRQRGIEGADRLVTDQQAWLRCDCTRDRCALPLASREVSCLGPGDSRIKADLFKQFEAKRSAFVSADVTRSELLVEHRSDRHPRRKRTAGVLKDKLRPPGIGAP